MEMITMIWTHSLIRSFCFSAVAIIALPAIAKPAAKEVLFSDYGVNKSPENAEFYKEAGASIMTVSTSGFLMPDKSDEEFAVKLAGVKNLPVKIIASNGFIGPRHLRCVGPKANHDDVLAWAETAIRRIHQAGGKMVIFGSGGSRRVPKDWPVEKANEQFVTLLKRMGPIAKKHDVVVALEQLNSKECNYINTIGEAASIIRAVDHPNVRLLADLYHMAMEGDTAEDLKKAVDLVVHVEIAEKEGRTFPGTQGDDFRPYFRVLRDAGYRAGVSIEGRGEDKEFVTAFAEIKKQAAEVMAEEK